MRDNMESLASQMWTPSQIPAKAQVRTSGQMTTTLLTTTTTNDPVGRARSSESVMAGLYSPADAAD